MENSMRTSYCEFISADEFRKQLAEAEPGARIIYAVGLLAMACDKAHNRAGEPWKELEAIRDAAKTAAGGREIVLVDEKIWEWGPDGEVCLVQRRVGPKPTDSSLGCFEYIAIKKHPKTPKGRVLNELPTRVHQPAS